MAACALLVLLAGVAAVPTPGAEPQVDRREAYDTGQGIIGVIGSPMGSEFELGREAKVLVAPAFARVEPGTYRVRVNLNGYEPQQTSVSVAAGEAVIIEAVLEPNFRVVQIESADEAVALPYGVYEVEPDRAAEMLGIRPRYPQEELIAFFDRAVPLALGVTVVLSLVDVAFLPPDVAPRVPVLTLAGQALTLGFAGGGLITRSRRDTFYRDYDPPEVVLRREAAQNAYEAARGAAAAGRLTEAETMFAEFIRRHGASADVPRAHLQRARLALAEGWTDQAESELRVIREQFPDLRVYDEAGVLLAGILRGRREHLAALDVLAGAPVLADGSYEPAEVSFQRLLSLTALAREDGERGTGHASADFVPAGIAEAERWLAEFSDTEAAEIRGAEVRCMLIDLYEAAGRRDDAVSMWNGAAELPPQCAPQGIESPD
jgi:tetratricopeptide (TPR) repeat protein